ncbi:hypothetical protein [Enterobacter sichuanensis]|uniref:hypothetical protein n=1 Tax=Enterobacter sichuanensis TaxID=2071710 RepID=UPI001747A177|nr:hypothetical protein [Enterobacter sichuanensis]
MDSSDSASKAFGEKTFNTTLKNHVVAMVREKDKSLLGLLRGLLCQRGFCKSKPQKARLQLGKNANQIVLRQKQAQKNHLSVVSRHCLLL